MAKESEFWGLRIPDLGESVDINYINENFELIDVKAKENYDSLSPAVNYSRTIYVDSVNGSDDNNGTETLPFMSLEKAVAEAKKYRACIINLAGGTYPTSAAIDVRGACGLRIFGLGTSENPAIINGRFSVGVGAHLTIGAVKITGETTTANGTIFVWEGGRVYLTDCTLSPVGGYGINANTTSIVYATGCTFEGTPTAIVRSLGGAQVTLRTCTDNSGTGALCQNVGRLELNGSASVTYRASGTGFVSVDNVQRYPVDLSTIAVSTMEL